MAEESESSSGVENIAFEEDFAFIREFVPKAGILSLTRENVTVLIIRTAYSRVQLRVLYTAKYPEEPPVVELSSPTLPKMLLRNKEKECLEKCRAEAQGKAHIPVIYSLIHRFIQTNLFVPCWKEIKQVMMLCEGKGHIGADEKEGLLHLKLQIGPYRQSIKIRVPPEYPEEGVSLEFCSSNFPSDVVFMFQAQASEIVRRSVAGMSPEAARSGSNPIELPPALGGGGSGGASSVVGKKASDSISARALTSSNLKALKHDIGVLKQISDLRERTQHHHKHVYSVKANAERREARKDLRRLAREEGEKDLEDERLVREQEQAEMLALLKLKASDTAQPSLLPVASFIIEDYAVRLPQEKCQACKLPVLHPDNPVDTSMTNPRSNHRPVRTYCGHWLHWHCLDKWLTTPPFIRMCPVCERRVWHPDWPSDHKQLEKAYAMKQARERECNDCADLMGF